MTRQIRNASKWNNDATYLCNFLVKKLDKNTLDIYRNNVKVNKIKNVNQKDTQIFNNKFQRSRKDWFLSRTELIAMFAKSNKILQVIKPCKD